MSIQYMMRFTHKIWANPPFMVKQHHNQQDEDENAQHREDRVPNRNSPINLINVWKVGRCGLYLFHILEIKTKQKHTHKGVQLRLI